MSGLNRDQINKLIFDNELFHGVLKNMGVVMDIVHLEKFTELVAAAEREACLKICDEQASGAYWEGADVCATLIRVRGQE
jgi:hypothetical protein